MDSKVSPFNRTAQHDAKRIAILSQAAALFNLKGSRATTLKDIAESLGLTKTSLYYYVKTKEELVFQCYMAALDNHHTYLDTLEQQQPDPAQRLLAFFSQQFDNWIAAQEGSAPHYAALLEIAALKAPHREAVEMRYVDLFKRLRNYLRDGVARGRLQSVEPTATTRALMGSVDWVFSWLHRVPKERLKEVRDQALDIVSHGVAQHCVSPEIGSGGFESSSTKLVGFDRDEQNRQKQEAFLKTGTRLFNTRGFSGTSLDDIAEQLNVSKGAFYYHIENKEDLLYRCYCHSLDVVEHIHKEAAQLDDQTGLEKAAYVCKRIFQAQNSDEGPLIRYTSIIALPQARRVEVLKNTEARNAVFGGFLEDGKIDGSVRSIDTWVAQQLIAGATNAAMGLGRWRDIGNINGAAFDYFSVFFNGLTPRQPT